MTAVRTPHADHLPLRHVPPPERRPVAHLSPPGPRWWTTSVSARFARSSRQDAIRCPSRIHRLRATAASIRSNAATSYTPTRSTPSLVGSSPILFLLSSIQAADPTCRQVTPV